jgi:hypothetical protein
MLKITPILLLSTALTLSPIGYVEAEADEAEALQILAALHDDDALTREIESDAGDRIRLAQRLSMLTQMVASSSCALTADVAVDESHDHLEEAMHEVDIIVDALLNGNETLHIFGPEERRRTAHDLETFLEEWGTTHAAVESVLSNGHDVESAHIIDDHNLPLLEKATILESDIVGQYSHPYEMTQADAMMLGIAGRQLMLTQKMSKDACEIWSGYHVEIGLADLQATMTIFENSLNALHVGMPAAGIQAAPTPEIEADLVNILGRWETIRGNLDKLIAGEALNEEQKYEIFHDFNLELEEINHLVQDYKNYTQRNHA